MIAQVIEAYKKLWEGIRQSREQKHRRMLESFKGIELKDYEEEVKECYRDASPAIPITSAIHMFWIIW